MDVKQQTLDFFKTQNQIRASFYQLGRSLETSLTNRNRGNHSDEETAGFKHSKLGLHQTSMGISLKTLLLRGPTLIKPSSCCFDVQLDGSNFKKTYAIVTCQA